LFSCHLAVILDEDQLLLLFQHVLLPVIVMMNLHCAGRLNVVGVAMEHREKGLVGNKRGKVYVVGGWRIC
jgi:hypothetical protein